MAFIGQRVFRTLITSGKHKGKPKCIVKGCNEPGQNTGNKRKDGSISYRKYCTKHHNERTAKRYGLSDILQVMAKKAGFSDVKKYQRHTLEKRAKKAGFSNANQYQRHILEKRAKQAGFDCVTDYINSKHEYRSHRKTCCENVDGRLGFVCTATIADKSMLEVDHINNNHKDNRKQNLHTLCANCHRYKTRYFGHYISISGIKKVFKLNIQKTKQKRKKSV